jgi:hypothetical protein
MRYNDGVKITKEQESAIIGMVLGDAYLQKTGELNARLRLEHRGDHAEYLVWKARLLPQLFQGKPTFLKRIHPQTHREYSYVRQQSNAGSYLGRIRKIFYPDGRKKIPKSLSRWLKSDIGFAIWFYDDGYYFKRDRAFYLYLGTVSPEEANSAHETIERNFDLRNTILNKKKKGFAIYFPASEREKIAHILLKYPVPVMGYKVPLAQS